MTHVSDGFASVLLILDYLLALQKATIFDFIVLAVYCWWLRREVILQRRFGQLILLSRKHKFSETSGSQVSRLIRLIFGHCWAFQRFTLIIIKIFKIGVNIERIFIYWRGNNHVADFLITPIDKLLLHPHDIIFSGWWSAVLIHFPFTPTSSTSACTLARFFQAISGLWTSIMGRFLVSIRACINKWLQTLFLLFRINFRSKFVFIRVHGHKLYVIVLILVKYLVFVLEILLEFLLSVRMNIIIVIKSCSPTIFLRIFMHLNWIF